MKVLHVVTVGVLLAFSVTGVKAQNVVLVESNGQGNITVDDAGHVYAAFGNTVSKFDAELNPIWSRDRVDALTTAVAADGSVYLGGDAWNTKLRPDGRYEKRFAAAARITDMEVANGSLYATGYHRENSDLWLARLDLAGDVIWSFTTPISHATSRSNQLSPSLSVDGSGRVWMSGHFSGTIGLDPGSAYATLESQGFDDIFAATYDADGLYVQAFSLGSPSADAAHDVAVDAAGDVYITGYFDGSVDFDPGPDVAELISPACYDAFVAKYDSDGRYLWAMDIGGQDPCAEANGYSLAVDERGGVYVTGYYFDHQGSQVDFYPGARVVTLNYIGEEDAFVAKYDTDGRFEWAFGLGSRYGDRGLGIEVGQDDNLYVVGNAHGTVDFNPGPESHILEARGSTFVARYTSTGTLAIPSSREAAPDPGSSVVQIYPNPVAEQAEIEISLRHSSDVSVGVHDLLGREMARLHDGPLAGGKFHRFTFDGTDLPNGVYVLRIHGVSLNTSRLLLIQR